jgi:hypothetical protein
MKAVHIWQTATKKGTHPPAHRPPAPSPKSQGNIYLESKSTENKTKITEQKQIVIAIHHPLPPSFGTLQKS